MGLILVLSAGLCVLAPGSSFAAPQDDLLVRWHALDQDLDTRLKDLKSQYESVKSRLEQRRQVRLNDCTVEMEFITQSGQATRIQQSCRDNVNLDIDFRLQVVARVRADREIELRREKEDAVYALISGRDVVSADPIIGTWRWFNGDTHTIAANGTISGQPANTWTLAKTQPRTYVIRWGDVYVDTLELSPNGCYLEGTNQNGGRVSATKGDC